MSEDLREELEVVQSIYCRQGECIINDTLGSPELEVRLQGEGDVTLTVTVRMQFPSLYPRQLPTVSCQCEDRSLSRELMTSLTDLSTQIQGTPMITDLLARAQEMINHRVSVEAQITDNNLDEIGSHQTPAPSEAHGGGSVKKDQGEGTVTAVLLLDHMRSKTRYIQTIQKWVTSLSIQGCLVFTGKLIFLVLQGHSANIKEYIKLQRSSNVDVDSRGKKCKERMMSVLYQGVVEGKGFQDFEVRECKSQMEIEEIFQQTELLPLYQEHIQPLLKSSNIPLTK
ncbi:RWD domain-containing protein 3-like [Saccostrea echinata]|uniref:RWD domain-containing protein 3-like n=1 Tax=Saccostrea echinata TaxID=191078 RepID=UPI002A7FC196|nr:RWD domain-containing protein 3-like [Saccostrea echinata]XP_061192585.1 RWD domain-containing protein 3-like [Saccostrea echinata]